MGNVDWNRVGGIMSTSPTPLLDSMSVEFGVPQCALDFAKDALAMLPSGPLGAVRNNILAGKQAAEQKFNEFMMVVDGECIYTEWHDNGEDKIHLKTGMSIKIPIGTAHTFTALTDFKFVSMLTKLWHSSNPPIIKIDKKE